MTVQLYLAVLTLALGGCATTSAPQLPRPGTTAPDGQDVTLAVYNVALGAVVGGIGRLVNGEGAPPLRRFAEGAGWGGAGGAVAYAGKWMAGEIGARERLAYGVPARLVHDAGVSMVENAARDEAPLGRFAAHLGPVRLDVRTRTGAVRARLLPLNAAVIALLLVNPDTDLSLGRSLGYGAPLFTGDGPEAAPVGSSSGQAVLGTAFVSRTDAEFHDTAAHERIHVFQFGEFVRYEAALRASLDPTPDREAGVERWLYLDSPVLLLLAYYAVEGGDIDAPCKFDNWFEREAEAFGSRRAVGVCP